MNAQEILETASWACNTTQKGAAELIGLNGSGLWARLKRGSLKADDFLAMLDRMGIDVTYTVRATGKKMNLTIRGAGRKVVSQVNFVKYSTDQSEALANDFYTDGENLYHEGRARELYVDKQGRYFFAEYSEYPGVKDRIIPVGADVAASFLETYGTDLHRGPDMEPERDS